MRLLILLILLPLFSQGQVIRTNPYYKPSVVTGCADADAVAWIAASGISDTTGLCKFFRQLKDSSALWDSLQAGYLFLGSTENEVKFNIKNPANTDAAFRLTFSGTWTFSTSGASETGSSYAETYYTPSSDANLNSSHISFYSQNSGSVGSLLGAGTSGLINGLYLYIEVGTYYTKNFGSSGASENPTPAPASTQGFFINSRINSTEYNIYRNYINKSTQSNTSSARTINSIRLMQINGSSFYGDFKVSFASIGRGLTDTQARALNNIVEELMDARGIGVQ